MSNSIHAVPSPNAQVEKQPSAAPPKSQQASAHASTPQDKVTISESAKLALSGNAKPSA